MPAASANRASRRRKVTRNIGIAALVVVTLAAFSVWLLSRESTLVRATDYVVRHMDGRLEVAGVRGSLLSNIYAQKLRYRDRFGSVEIEEAKMIWRPVRLLIGQVAVGAMSASRVALELAETDDERAKPPQSLRSPMSFAITDFTIDAMTIKNASGTHELRGLRAAFAGDKKRLQAEVKSLATTWGHVKGKLKIGADTPFDMDGELALVSLDPADYKLDVKLKGSLLNAEADLDALARSATAKAKLALAPFDPQPLTHLEFSAKDFDPHAWSPSAPTAALSGEGRVTADAERKLDGAFEFANSKPGPIDDRRLPFARLSATVQGVPEQLALPVVKLDLGGAGQFAGAGEVREGALDLRLATRNLDLSGVQKRLHKTQLAGRLALGASPQTQRVAVDLSQQRYQVRFAGALRDRVITVNEAYARAGNAQLATRGKVTLNAHKDFSVDGRLTNFDPAQFGNYPSQLINSRFDAKGRIEPVIQVAGNVQVTDSRFFNMPATATGVFTTRRADHPEVDLNVAMNVGKTRATAKGTLKDPARLESIDLQLTLAGASLDELYKIVSVPLPPTPPYRISGRLVQKADVWEFQKFAGTVGDSDLSGSFVVDRRRSPQFMKADLTSNRLDLADLAGFVGAEKTAPRQVTSNSPRVLPETPYNLEKLKAADADIVFRGKRVITEKLPVDDMHAHLIVKGGVLTLAPLNFGAAGGRLVSSITMDGSRSVIASRADIRIESLQLAQILPQLKVSQASVGEMDGRVRLTARGNSIAAMLGSANGDTTLLVGEGEVSDLIMRLTNLDVANTLLVLMRGDKNIPIRCAVADLAFENGIMRPRQLVFDTAHTSLVGEGQVNFANETLDLRLVAKPKGGSLIALRGPINVKGTFRDPSVLPDMQQLALRGAAATALAVVATPLAALAPLVQLGKRSDIQCAPLVQEAKQKIQQPATAIALR